MGLCGTGTVAGRDSYRVISLSMVKNEQDIIEPFLRHHAPLLDCMVILDNASVDGTRRIAIECAKELKNVIVADNDEFGYYQAERMTRLLRYCQTALFADFILLLDADEFLALGARSELITVLEAIPIGGIGLLPWRTYVLVPGGNAMMQQDPPRSMRWRRVEETPLFRKIALRLNAMYRPDLEIQQGNHSATAASGGALPSVDLNLPLLHFPVRCKEQFAAKSVVGWMAYLAKTPNARAERNGYQWAEGFDRVTGSGSQWKADPCENSLTYAQERQKVDWNTDVVEDPYPFRYSRRYSSGAYCDALSLVARSWERSVSPSTNLHWERSNTAVEVQSTGGTSFEADWHWDNLFVDVAPFRFIAEKYCPTEVLDVGCGIGAYLDIFKRFGAQSVFGMDGIPLEVTVLQPHEYQVRDLSQPFDLGRVFDLVVNVEVAEHVSECDSRTVVECIAKHATRLIVFSAAEPGQPGHGHINCQPISYWLEYWAELGWVPD